MISVALDGEFRSTADVAESAGMDAHQAAPVLGHMRRVGAVEWRQRGGISLWRQPPDTPDDL